MRYVPLLVSTIALANLAACGVNAVPEVSDIKESLNTQFGGCKYIKVGNVNKLNGRDIGNGRYSVEQEFTLEILPDSQFVAEYEKLRSEGAAVEQIDQGVKDKANAIIEANKAEAKKLRKEFQQLEESDFPSRDAYFAASDEYVRRFTKLEGDYPPYLDMLKKANEDAGYPANADAYVEKLRAALHKKVVAQFDSTCNKMTSNGKTMVLETAGLSPNSQIEAMVKGKQAQFRGSVIYTKTEKGWMR